MKVETSRRLLRMYPTLHRLYWDKEMWARGYYCCSSGQVTDEDMKDYIQSKESDRRDDDDFGSY
jgi:putative transposase